MPVGEYLLEDGRLVVVEEEGTIADVREVSDEVPAKEEETKEEETEDLEEEEKEETEDLGYATKEELAEVKNMIEEIKAMLEPKEDLSTEAQAPLKSRTVKEEFSEELPKEVKAELSEAAAKPIKHNPEAETKKINRVEFGKGKFNTTFDKVMEQISKIKN